MHTYLLVTLMADTDIAYCFFLIHNVDKEQFSSDTKLLSLPLDASKYIQRVRLA